jgi:hypothetical protein
MSSQLRKESREQLFRKRKRELIERQETNKAAIYETQTILENLEQEEEYIRLEKQQLEYDHDHPIHQALHSYATQALRNVILEYMNMEYCTICQTLFPKWKVGANKLQGELLCGEDNMEFQFPNDQDLVTHFLSFCVPVTLINLCAKKLRLHIDIEECIILLWYQEEIDNGFNWRVCHFVLKSDIDLHFLDHAKYASEIHANKNK